MDYEYSKRIRNAEKAREEYNRLGIIPSLCADCSRIMDPGEERFLIIEHKGDKWLGRILCAECNKKLKPHVGA